MLDTLSEELKQTRAFEQQMREFAALFNKEPNLLETLSDAVDNGISRDAFRDLYVSLAAEHELNFTTEQMDIAMHEQKQGKDKVLPSAVQKLITIL